MSRKEYLYSGLFAIITALGFWVYQHSGKRDAVVIPIPKVVIDPAVWQKTEEAFSNPIIPAPLYVPPADIGEPYPHELPEFGNDNQRNTDTIDINTYLNLPLVGDNVTYENKYVHRDLDEEEVATPSLKRFSYFRLVVVETRGKGPKTEIGGIKFLSGQTHVTNPLATCWNPRTGEQWPFKETDAWSDSDSRELVIKFPAMVHIDSYKLRTGSGIPNSDPVKWRLEGSLNGTFWVVLDDRTNGKAYVPPIRNIWTTWIIA